MPFDGIDLSATTQALIRGRRRIEAGWCQGVMRTRKAVCAVGAVSSDDKALRMLHRAFGRQGGLPDWNDEPTRTKDDVLSLYDRAIALSLNTGPPGSMVRVAPPLTEPPVCVSG
jgi:hypothetical protein